MPPGTLPGAQTQTGCCDRGGRGFETAFPPHRLPSCITGEQSGGLDASALCFRFGHDLRSMYVVVRSTQYITILLLLLHTEYKCYNYVVVTEYYHYYYSYIYGQLPYYLWRTDTILVYVFIRVIDQYLVLIQRGNRKLAGLA